MLLVKPESKSRCVVMILAVLLAVLAGVAHADVENSSSTQPGSQMSVEEADALIVEVKETADEVEAILKSFRSPRFDQRTVLEDVDYELDAVLEWVRTETRWVPYRGVLRGAAGVLMDRRGNSLDRSLLLAELVAKTGYETRLVRSSLDPETARALLEAHAFKHPDNSPKASNEPEDETALASQTEVAAQARVLAKLAGIEGSTDGAVFTDQYLADISDHWWVQARGDSGWRDLDPMAPAGSARFEKEELAVVSVGEIPEDQFHRLSVKVVIERWEAGSLTEETPLSHEFAVAQVPLFSHFEINFLPHADGWIALEEEDGGLEFLEIAGSAEYWGPSLKIGGQTVSGDWFNNSGNLAAPTTLIAARQLGEGTQALAELGGAQAEEAPETHLTAAWLEFEISDPAGHGEIVRREIFDLLGGNRDPSGGPATLEPSVAERNDRGLALLGVTSGLVINSTPHREVIEKAIYETWSKNRNTFIALLYQASGRGEDERVPIVMGQVEFRPINLIAMAALRELRSRHGDITYLDRANVIASHLVHVQDNDATTMQFATDIVINRIGVMPGVATDARIVRLEQGVLDTLVETTFSRGNPAHNTFRHFAERSRESENWITVQSASSAEEFLQGLPGPDRARISSIVNNGGVVVSSSATYAFGQNRFASWWQIDPGDGTTLGRGYRGWGTETGERLTHDTIKTPAIKESTEKVGHEVACELLQAAADVTVELTLDEIQLMQMRDSSPRMRANRMRTLKMMGKAAKDIPCKFW